MALRFAGLRRPMPAVEEMVFAIKAKDEAAAKRLLDADASLAHARIASGESMLLLAAYLRADAIVALLLARGARPNVWEAAAVGRLDRLRELVNGDAKLLGARSHDGWTPLHLAAHFGQKEAAAFLLAKGADVHARSTNPLENTPLHAAIAGRQHTLVALLLQHGADPDAAYAGHGSALYVAAHGGDDASARLLLCAKARPDAPGADGKTPLQIARERGHEKVARLLEQHFARG